MQQLNIYEVKTHLSKLVEQAHNGETIIIAKSGKPWAKIIPFDTPKKRFKFGTMEGKIKVSDDFNIPIPDNVIDLLEPDAIDSVYRCLKHQDKTNNIINTLRGNK